MSMDSIATCIVGALVVIIPALVVYLKSYLEKMTEKQRIETELLRKQLEEMQASNMQGIDRVLQQTKPGAIVHGIDDDDLGIKGDVTDTLEKLRVKAGATRVTLWSFHNGSYYSTGNPQRKIQTTFETLPPDRKVPSEADILKSESVNGFLCVLKPMSAGAFQAAGGYEVEPGIRVLGPCEHCCHAETCANSPDARPQNSLVRCTIDDMPFGSRFYRIMSDIGTKVWYGRFLTDKEGNKLAVITVQFDNEGNKAFKFPDLADLMCDTCNRVIASIHAMRNFS